MALSESCIDGNIGFESSLTIGERWDAFLFGEAQSRILVSLPKEKITEMENVCRSMNLPYVQIGMVGGENIKIGDLTFVGAGSVIIPQISIGSNVTIGAGSTVINNIKNNFTVYGNPAK